MTNMKPKDGASIEAPSLRGLQGRSATGLNGQAAKDEVSAVWQGGWMPENISGVPAGRSVFHLTSPLIGLLRGRAPGGGSAGNHLGIADDRSWVQTLSPLSRQVVAALREADARLHVHRCGQRPDHVSGSGSPQLHPLGTSQIADRGAIC